MGNRAVIVHESVTPENADKHLGIYLHWYGSPETVELFLEHVKGKISDYSDPQYCMARLCQSIANDISDGKVEECSIGIGIVSRLDCRNFDNGVYYFNNAFDIVRQTSGKEFEIKGN